MAGAVMHKAWADGRLSAGHLGLGVNPSPCRLTCIFQKSCNSPATLCAACLPAAFKAQLADRRFQAGFKAWLGATIALVVIAAAYTQLAFLGVCWCWGAAGVQGTVQQWHSSASDVNVYTAWRVPAVPGPHQHSLPACHLAGVALALRHCWDALVCDQYCTKYKLQRC